MLIRKMPKNPSAVQPMADVVSSETRSRMMSGIRGKNTKPELLVRRLLHAKGFRFRIHATLSGKPDLVFPKWAAAVFVHGCFWHGHDCHLFKWPKTRLDFWRAKISGNVARDKANVIKLCDSGWRVGVVWECALKGRTKLDPAVVTESCSKWLKSTETSFELAGD